MRALTQDESPGWLRACAERVRERGLDPRLIEILRAFQSPIEPQSPDRFDGAERLPALDLVDALDGEVDRDQAELFARRYRDVLALPGGEDWAVLRVGLAWRMAGIVASPGPRARRVRALIDFAFAHAASLRWADPALPAPGRLPVSWRHIAQGLEHGRIEGPSAIGPVHVNLLCARGLRLETLDSRGSSLEGLVAASGALAGVSGGFFLYSEPDIEPPSRRGDPVGLLVHEGEVVNPPWLRRAALVQDRDGRVRIEVIAVEGPRWTRAYGSSSPADAGPVAAVVGSAVVARGEGALPIPLAGAVVPDPPPRWDPGPIRSAIAGGPMLLRGAEVTLALEPEEFANTAPPVTFSQDETFDQNLLPRMGVGQTADGALIFAAVDGRNFDRAPGMTLRQLAELLRAQGCVTAMNLDGGSSKRMVVGGRVVDLPSTEVVTGGGAGPIRPVHSAILLHPEPPR